MIDTDKYEGHYKGSWANQYGDVVKLVYPNESSPSLNADQRLIIDAPLLLEEVKRLREAIKIATTDLEEPNMHEETRKDLLDMLKEMIE